MALQFPLSQTTRPLSYQAEFVLAILVLTAHFELQSVGLDVTLELFTSFTWSDNTLPIGLGY